MYTPPTEPEDGKAQPHRRFRSLEYAAAALGVVGVLWALTVAVDPTARPGWSKRARSATCMLNEKQMLVGMQMYAQDDDGRLPPVAALMPANQGPAHLAAWAAAVPSSAAGDSADGATGLLNPYVRDARLFHCPDAPRTSAGLTYMINDLAAGRQLQELARPPITVLVVDGDNTPFNFGHAASGVPEPVLGSAFLPDSRHPNLRLFGGAVSTTALTRHYKGAIYGFADGHVKWFRPDDVFFPSRFDRRSGHRDRSTGDLIGPDPAGDMTYRGRAYRATFHLR